MGNWHILGLTRKYLAENRGTHNPYNFGETARYYREDIDVDVAVQTVTPMNRHGYFNFGPLCNFKKAVFDKAKVKVVEVIEDMPWCYGGYDECIHLSDVDYVIENTTDRMIAIPSPGASETDKVIAQYIADLIPKDGPCLQIGIGGLPDTVLRLLADSGAKDIGIHTEMVTEAMVELHEAGLITGKKRPSSPKRSSGPSPSAAGSSTTGSITIRRWPCIPSSSPTTPTSFPSTGISSPSTPAWGWISRGR